jgi:hypothetical protein
MMSQSNMDDMDARANARKVAKFKPKRYRTNPKRYWNKMK